MNRLASRWTIGLGFLAFWLLMMGLLVYRERGPRLFSFSQAPRFEEPTLLEPRETWMGLFVHDHRVGYLHVGERPERRHDLEGATTELEARAAVSPLGHRGDFDLVGEVWRSARAPRADFSFTVRSGESDFQVAGRISRGRLEAEVRSRGETVPLSVPVDEKLVFSAGFGTAVEFPALAVGDEATLESFDPLTLRKTTIRVQCVAEENLVIAGEVTPLRRLEVTSGAISSHVWIDDAGSLAQITTPLGLTLRRIDPAALDRSGEPTGDDGESPR